MLDAVLGRALELATSEAVTSAERSGDEAAGRGRREAE
jgi:hypothetical protein